eukprot:2455233-Amphidinium_carterae.1
MTLYVPIAKDSSSLLWASGDASLAPSGGKSHEGSVILHGIGEVPSSIEDAHKLPFNLISWRSARQQLVALSS